MPVFKVLCRKDAFIDYVADVEASSAAEAAALAYDDPDSYEWERDGDQEFDATCYIALDKEGAEIAATECGDF
jgi:hypothetical protein